MANAWIIPPLTPASIAMYGASSSVFDFSGGALPAGATLTRAGAATYFNAAGAMVTASANTPRFDYQGGVLRGLLIEPAATNLVLQSARIDLAPWAPQIGGTMTAVTGGYSPDGTNAGATLTDGSNTQPAAWQQGVSTAAGNVYSRSFYVVADTVARNTRVMAFTLGNDFWVLDTKLGQVAKVAGAGNSTATVTAVSGYWFVQGTMTEAAGTVWYNHFYPAFGRTANVNDALSTAFQDAALTGSAVAASPQMELGVPSSYIPTGAATASRAADVLTLNWGSKGVPDGDVAIQYTFDDGSTQMVATTVSGGLSVVPTTLIRSKILSAKALAPDVGAAPNLLNDYAGIIVQASCASGANNAAIIAIDFGADVAIDTMMLFGVELFPASGTLSVLYATAAQGNFTGAYTTDATGVPYAGSTAMASGKGVSLWSSAAPITARYVNLVFAAGAGQAGRALRASRLVIGKRIQLERNFSFGAAFGVRDLGSLDFSARGVLLRRRAKKLRLVSLSFSNVRKDEVEQQTKPLLERIGNTEMVALLTDPVAHAERQNRAYFGPLVGDLSQAWRNAVAFEAKTNMVSIF